MSYSSIFDSIQQPILVVDREGLVRYGNGAASLLLDITQKRMSLGKPLLNFVQFSPNPLEEGKGLSAIDEETRISEVSFTLANGQTGWVQISLQPQPEFLTGAVGAGDRWIMSMRDVTLERTLHAKYRGELDQKEAVIKDLEVARQKLEEYSQGLEAKVRERTAELSELNRLFKTILDSLGQGILVFDVHGLCMPVYSKACEKLFGTRPDGKRIEETFGLNTKQSFDFMNWRIAVFEDRLDFEDMLPLATTNLEMQSGLTLSLDYAPMRDENGTLEGIVVAATDRTRAKAALKKVEEERQFVEKILRLAKNRTAFRMFLRDARERFRSLGDPEGKSYDEILREVHTIKGGAASFSLQSLATACHDLETQISSTGERNRTILNTLLKQRSSELLAVLEDEIARLAQIFGRIDDEGNDRLVELSLSTLLGWSLQLLALQELKEAHGLGETIRRAALEKPIGPAFDHYSSSLKDLAKRQGKVLDDFRIEGGFTRVPLEPLQPLLTSLVHALRNCVYHGLESPDERKIRNKPEGGTIILRFTRFEGTETSNRPWLKIEVTDDGRGINPEMIRKKLVASGRKELAALSDQEVIQAVFMDNFSTAGQVDQVAGRGVGLSAVSGEAKQLGGHCAIRSVYGEGTIITIDVPYPTAWSDQERKILGAA